MTNNDQTHAQAEMPAAAVPVFESRDYRVFAWAGFVEIQDLNTDDAVAIEIIHAVGIAMQILEVCGDMPVTALAQAPEHGGGGGRDGEEGRRG